jgi:hypothetical protein
MTNDEEDYHIANIRKLLIEAFTVKDLRRFCEDRPIFRPIVARFSPEDGVIDMVDEVIGYCRTHLLWDVLLTEVAQERWDQYARFQPELGKSAPPPPPRPARQRIAVPATGRASYWIAGARVLGGVTGPLGAPVGDAVQIQTEGSCRRP